MPVENREEFLGLVEHDQFDVFGQVRERLGVVTALRHVALPGSAPSRSDSQQSGPKDGRLAAAARAGHHDPGVVRQQPGQLGRQPLPSAEQVGIPVAVAGQPPVRALVDQRRGGDAGRG